MYIHTQKHTPALGISSSTSLVFGRFLIHAHYTSRAPSGTKPTPKLAFTSYCHYQYCMIYGISKGGRGGASYIGQ